MVNSRIRNLLAVISSVIIPVEGGKVKRGRMVFSAPEKKLKKGRKNEKNSLTSRDSSRIILLVSL
jgi:hypothetical protein